MKKLQIEIDLERGYKTCKICLENKPLNKYELNKRSNVYRTSCHSCRSKGLKINNINFPKFIINNSTGNTLQKCSHCSNYKELTEFTKNKNTKHGTGNTCKSCRYEWQILNKKKCQEYKSHPEIRARNNVLRRERYKSLEYRNKILSQNKQRNQTELYKQTIRIYRQKRKKNVYYQLRKTLGRRIDNALTKIKTGFNVKKCDSTIELLGCSLIELKIYLESKFLRGMTWQNRGSGNYKWHVDHIRPCCSYDLTNPDEQKQCFHYTNLQPLWQADNLSKGSKYKQINP